MTTARCSLHVRLVVLAVSLGTACGCASAAPATRGSAAAEPLVAARTRTKLDPDACPAGSSEDPDERAEIAMGCVIDWLLRSAFRRDPDARRAAYVQAVGERVARCSARPELPWRFALTDGKQVQAYALPGGLVMLSRATLDAVDSEAELGAILGHEIAHVSLGHSQSNWDPRTPPAADDAVERARDPDEERQADELGTVYLASAGYDPRAMFDALHALEAAESVESSDGCSDCRGEDPHPAWPARLARVSVAAGRGTGERAADRYRRMRAGDAVTVPEFACR